MNKNNTNYPRFISNKACGEDKTEGSSQKYLVEAIAEHIVSTDAAHNSEQNLSRIIGLKGEWGTGKTNVIKQLQKDELIKDKYHIFEYDAWGHQEDLHRRSFLETLTTELINGGLLSGETKIHKKNGKEETITWDKKLKYLLASKREVETEKRPKLNDSFILFVISIAFTPTSVSIIEILFKDNLCWLAILLSPLIPWLISLIILLFRKKRWKKFFKKELWKEIVNGAVSIYSGKIESDISYETISEEEPSVMEFQRWMKDISDYLGKSDTKKKLIIVYDNMDRLPADKVKKLWSSIHTFFSENGFDNIWVIIPFDEMHLSCAFGEEKDKKEELTKHFISKTFPIVYRVTPQVITDYKGLFNRLFEEAFSTTESQNTKNAISRIFRIQKPNATVREIIEFINQLVTLKRIWGNEIDLLHSAIFIIKEKEILENPIEQILSGNYLGSYIDKIVTNNEELQTNISALVYGVSKEHSKQIPMKEYIESCFDNKECDISKYSQSFQFISILQESIQNADDVKLDGIITALSSLKVDKFSNADRTIITSLWDELAARKEKQELSEQKFDQSHKILLPKISNKDSFVKRVCEQLQYFGKDTDKSGEFIFSGKKYYESLRDMETCLSEHNINIDVLQYLKEIEKEPKVFIEYMKMAKEDYVKFKLFTDNSNLNNHFFNEDDYKLDDLSVLKYIKKDDKRYKFDILKQKIEEFIPSAELNDTNFKQIFDAYKIIANEKPLETQLKPIQRNQIWSAVSNKIDTNEYLEIVTILLANNINISSDLSEAQIAYIASQMDYYANYGTLLVSGNDYASLNSVLKYMTENKLGYRLSLEKVLPHFFKITVRIDVTESVLLMKLNNWEKHKNSITKDNILQVIPNADFFIHSIETKNSLTNYLNKTVIEALKEIDEDTLYSHLQQPNQYWYKVIDNLIDTDFCKTLPDNLFNLGVRYLIEVATKDIVPKENGVKDRIINKLDKRKTGSTILEIRNKFCNSESAVNEDKFLYLERWLRQQGELKKRATEVIHKIIDPIIDDTNSLNLIVDNPDFYAEIINTASDINATKEKIQKKVNSSEEDSKLIEFAKKIEITKKEDK